MKRSLVGSPVRAASASTGLRGRARGVIGALVALPLVASCGGAKPDAGAATPTASAPPADAPGRAKKIAEAYAAFSFEACHTGEDCGALFAKSVSEETSGAAAWNPRGHMDSPDPEWIPEWGRLQTGPEGARYTFAALALAATRKSWARACTESHAAFAKRLDARLADLEPKLARIRMSPNPYDRIGDILALQPEKPQKGALGEFTPGSDAVRYTWEAALYDAFNETGRTFVYAFDGYAPSEELVAVMRPRQGQDYERDAYCIDAAKGLVPNAPALPDTSSWDAEVREMVRPAIGIDREALVKERRGQLALQVKAKFANAMSKNPSLPEGIRELSVGTVTKFVRNGKAASVVVTQLREEKKANPDGTQKTVKIDETSSVEFADWPSGVVLDPGDSLSFYGAEKTVKDTVIKSTPELEHLSRQRTVDGRHVTSVVTKAAGK
ncbi:MAG TPA: hypothetical protein VL400_17445, partial [Polyangiaceae bacterium]|nr:hypothetical protein [Polyangiaceae bacterium]